MTNKRNIILVFFIFILFFSLVACSSLTTSFKGNASREDIIGSWKYTKSSGSGIDLTLNPDFTYYYEEFGTKGQTLYKATGRYFYQGNNLKLRGLEEDELRFDDFQVDLIIREDGRKVLRLAATLARTMDFYSTSLNSTTSSSNADKEVTNAETILSGQILALNGLYSNPDMTLIISNGEITVSEKDGKLLNGRIESIIGNTINFSLDGETYSLAYIFMNDTITLINKNERIVFNKEVI